MGIRVVNIHKLCYIVAEVEANGKRHDIPRYDVRVDFVFQI